MDDEDERKKIADRIRKIADEFEGVNERSNKEVAAPTSSNGSDSSERPESKELEKTPIRKLREKKICRCFRNEEEEKRYFVRKYGKETNSDDPSDDDGEK